MTLHASGCCDLPLPCPHYEPDRLDSQGIVTSVEYEQMFDVLVAARSSLDEIAGVFDASALSPVEALRVVDELGAIRRVVDGMVAKTAKRVSETQTTNGDTAALVARSLGVRAGEVRAASETATHLENLA